MPVQVLIGSFLRRTISKASRAERPLALRLMDRERDGLDGQEIAAYRDWARLAAIGILFSLSATVASFGYLIDWWGVLEVTATLFIASVVSVAVLTVSVLRRTGVI